MDKKKKGLGVKACLEVSQQSVRAAHHPACPGAVRVGVPPDSDCVHLEWDAGWFNRAWDGYTVKMIGSILPVLPPLDTIPWPIFQLHNSETGELIATVRGWYTIAEYKDSAVFVELAWDSIHSVTRESIRGAEHRSPRGVAERNQAWRGLVLLGELFLPGRHEGSGDFPDKDDFKKAVIWALRTRFARGEINPGQSVIAYDLGTSERTLRNTLRRFQLTWAGVVREAGSQHQEEMLAADPG